MAGDDDSGFKTSSGLGLAGVGAGGMQFVTGKFLPGVLGKFGSSAFGAIGGGLQVASGVVGVNEEEAKITSGLGMSAEQYESATRLNGIFQEAEQYYDTQRAHSIARGLTSTAAGIGGGFGGAALGTFLGGPVGAVVGGAIGSIAISFGSDALYDALLLSVDPIVAQMIVNVDTSNRPPTEEEVFVAVAAASSLGDRIKTKLGYDSLAMALQDGKITKQLMSDYRSAMRGITGIEQDENAIEDETGSGPSAIAQLTEYIRSSEGKVKLGDIAARVKFGKVLADMDMEMSMAELDSMPPMQHPAGRNIPGMPGRKRGAPNQEPSNSF